MKGEGNIMDYIRIATSTTTIMTLHGPMMPIRHRCVVLKVFMCIYIYIYIMNKIVSTIHNVEGESVEKG